MESTQDIMRLANPPELLFDNDRVRVLRCFFRPGEHAQMHSHPDHITYPTKEGRLKIVSPFGETEIMDYEAGKVLFFEGESHEVTNIGDSETELIVVELK